MQCAEKVENHSREHISMRIVLQLASYVHPVWWLLPFDMSCYIVTIALTDRKASKVHGMQMFVLFGLNLLGRPRGVGVDDIIRDFSTATLRPRLTTR
jgi:hypothetical protein